jgi:hypothetical protein
VVSTAAAQWVAAWVSTSSPAPLGELVAWALRDWCRLAGTATTYTRTNQPQLT